MEDLLNRLIKEHEGLRLKPYRCPAGKLTIGYGRNLEDIGITLQEAEFLRKNDLASARSEAHKFFWFENLNLPRQAVIISMLYNIGMTRFRRFAKMISALEVRDYQRAGDEMLNSVWASQVGKRAKTLSDIMKLGVV